MEDFDITRCLRCPYCKDRKDFDERYEHSLFCTYNNSSRDPFYGKRLNILQSCPKFWNLRFKHRLNFETDLIMLEINHPGITQVSANRANEYLNGLGINKNNASNFGNLVGYAFRCLIDKVPLEDWKFYEMVMLKKAVEYKIVDINSKTANEVVEIVRSNVDVKEILGGIDTNEDFDDSGKIYVSLKVKPIRSVSYVAKENIIVLELADANDSYLGLKQILEELKAHHNAKIYLKKKLSITLYPVNIIKQDDFTGQNIVLSPLSSIYYVIG